MNRCQVKDCRDMATYQVRMPHDVMKGSRHIVCSKHAVDFALLEPIMLTVTINRGFIQFECPSCRKAVLTPDMQFSTSRPCEEGKRRDIFCACCGTLIAIKVFSVGEPEIHALKPAFIYPKDTPSVSATGIKHTTETFIRYDPFEKVFEARCGFAMMGTTNFDSSIGACPFDPNFRDNYVSGKDMDMVEAVKKMVAETQKNAEVLWSM